MECSCHPLKIWHLLDLILFFFLSILGFISKLLIAIMQFSIFYYVLQLHLIFFFFFQKEVSRLRGLVNGGGESLVNDTFAISIPASPGSFKWEGLHGSFSPLASDKRMSQVRTSIFSFMRNHMARLLTHQFFCFTFYRRKIMNLHSLVHSGGKRRKTSPYRLWLLKMRPLCGWYIPREILIH